MAKLLIANEVRIGGLGGGRLQTDDFEALPHLIRVATVVDFEADVPGGNWVTVGFDSPLVRLVTCIGDTEKRALVEGEMKQEWSLTLVQHRLCSCFANYCCLEPSLLFCS